MSNFISFLIKDPIVAIAAIICVVAIILIFVLINLYNKLKEQQIISEAVSAVETQTLKKKSKVTSAPVGTEQIKTPSQRSSPYEIDLILAQLSEISTQINAINDRVKQISDKVLITKDVQSLAGGETSFEDTIKKVIQDLQNLKSEVESIKQIDKNSAEIVTQVNNKLDNLLKLLSTILQQ
ncbi:MAG: hypothetical protein NZ928_05540 [Endomicrobia bacterium]|nr:hypothetical protein [Endomicrobiia bacterium]MDW8055762.1 hypothetical protein [Elusimicrobiota bacterium]